MYGLLNYKSIHNSKILDKVLLHESNKEGSGISWVADVNEEYIWNVAFEKTMMFHKDYPNFINKKASYYVGAAKRSTEKYMRGLYFLDVKDFPFLSAPENKDAIVGRVQWIVR